MKTKHLFPFFKKQLFLFAICAIFLIASIPTNLGADGQSQGIKTGWVDRNEYVTTNADGSYTSTFYLNPQTYFNNATGTFETLKFVVDPAFKTQQATRFFLQNAHVAIEISNQAATYFDPDYQRLCIASEMFTVESPQGQGWRDTGIGTATPTWIYQNDTESVTLTRIQTIQGVGQLNLTYSLGVGSFLKHTVSFRSDQAGTFRVAIHLDGIVNNYVKTNSGAEYTVGGEVHVLDSGFVVGSDNANLVYQENLRSVFNQSNTATTGNLTDIVFNTGANGMKTDVYIGSWELDAGEILGFDPSTSTYPVNANADDGEVQGNSVTSYALARTTTTGSSTSSFQVGQFYNSELVYWGVRRPMLRIDTSTFPYWGTLESAELSLYIDTWWITGSNFTVKVRDWTGAVPIDTGDWTSYGASNLDDDGFSTSSITGVGWYNITLSDTSTINTSGYSDFFFLSSRDLSATEPTGNEYINIADYSDGSSYSIRLIITYSGTAPAEIYVDNNTSNIDSSANIGTQSNFTAQKYTDLSNDTLTEAAQYTYSNSTLLNDGFEGGTFGNWDGNGATTWTADGGILTAATGNLEGWASTPHAGTYHAGTGATGDGALTSDSFDASTASTIYISFWYAVDDTDGNGELVLSYYDGAAYDTIQDLSGGTEDTWTYFSATVTDNQYFDATFRIRFTAAGGNGEAVFIDDVLIIRESIATTNYRLEIEEQFTLLNYTRTYEELCIYAGNGWTGTTEDLDVQVWNGEEWQLVIDGLDSNSWNNASVTEYLTSADLYIRFVDGTQVSDTSQNTWTIDAVLIHSWNLAGIAYTISSTVDVDFTATYYCQVDYVRIQTVGATFAASQDHDATYSRVYSVGASFENQDLVSGGFKRDFTGSATFQVSDSLAAGYTLPFTLSESFGLDLLQTTFYSLVTGIASTFTAALSLSTIRLLDLAIGFTGSLSLVFVGAYSLLSSLGSTFAGSFSFLGGYGVLATLGGQFTLMYLPSVAYNIYSYVSSTFTLNNFLAVLIGARAYFVDVALGFTASLSLNLGSAYHAIFGVNNTFGASLISQTIYNVLFSVSSTFDLVNYLSTLRYIFANFALSFTASASNSFTSAYHLLLSQNWTANTSLIQNWAARISSGISNTFNLSLLQQAIYNYNSASGFTANVSILSQSLMHYLGGLNGVFTANLVPVTFYGIVLLVSSTFGLDSFLSVIQGVHEYFVTLALGLQTNLVFVGQSVYNIGSTVGASLSITLDVIQAIGRFIETSLTALFSMDLNAFLVTLSSEDWFVIGGLVAACVFLPIFAILIYTVVKWGRNSDSPQSF